MSTWAHSHPPSLTLLGRVGFTLMCMLDRCYQILSVWPGMVAYAWDSRTYLSAILYRENQASWTRPQLNNKQTKMLLILLFWCFISKRKYFPRTSVCELATQDTAFPLYSLRISIHFTRRQKRSFYICLMETAPSGPPQPKTPLCWLPPALLQAVS